ncbi:MAG: endonuclease domain-containing protein [Phycisphaerales bacterium JB039]
MRFNRDRNSDSNSARDRARSLRREATLPERKLWSYLKDRRLAGLKFRRQHPLDRYTVDFFCAEAALVVELDGQRHDAARDSARDAVLRAIGFEVLRLSVSYFEPDQEAAIRTIRRIAEDRIASLRDEALKGEKPE